MCMAAYGDPALTKFGQGEAFCAEERPMTDRKRTRQQERDYKRLLLELHDQERWFKDFELRQTLLPKDWHKMDRIAPVTPEKVRLTLRVDKETVTFFRKMGSGWHARVNAVLRAYMLSVISKEVEGTLDRDWKGDAI